MAEEVKLYGMWASHYSRRIELALKLKGVRFEYVEKDPHNMSPELLKYNPVYKKIPVLLHNRKPVAESLLILEYIDEIWQSNPILPQDPYQKAMARFWARFIEEKVLPTGLKAYLGAENEKEHAIKELCEQLKLLENELNGKDFFGGDTIGYVDIVANFIAFWFPVAQEIVGIEICNEEKFPVLLKWISRVQDIDVVHECQPPREKLLAHVRARYEAARSAPK